MTESSIQVAVRIRPLNAKEISLLAPVDTSQPFQGDGGLAGSPSKAPNAITAMRTNYIRNILSPVDDRVLVFDPAVPAAQVRGLKHAPQLHMHLHGNGRRARDVRYAFDRVFPPSTTQQEVYQGTVEPMLTGILSGFNASVFAYGATGCGKTHTISGSSDDPGLIFLTMRGLYEKIEQERDQFETNVRLSYLEIYNETIRDLLSASPTTSGPGLALREDAASKISVVGISEHTPESPEQVLEMITEGNRRRTQSPTEANAVSSRSHAVLQLNVTRKPRTADTVEEMCSASLNIIDLAGSERASATNNQGMRMKEGANINRSLLALGSCINALCQTGGSRNVKGRHIPYRNSKLTRLLKFSLGGNCKTVMIVCVSPSSAHYEETHNTLKYANQAKNIQTKVTRNLLHIDRHVAQYVHAIASLRQEVQELKEKLASNQRGEPIADREKREASLADAIQQLESLAREQRKAECQAAKDAATSYASAAIRKALVKASASHPVDDRNVLQQILEQTPNVPQPTQPVSQLSNVSLHPLVSANPLSMQVYTLKRAQLETDIASAMYKQTLESLCEMLQDTIGSRLVELALSTANASSTLQNAADRLKATISDDQRSDLANQLSNASESARSTLTRAMGTEDLRLPVSRGEMGAHAANTRPRLSLNTRPSTDSARFMRFASPRRRTLRPSLASRPRNPFDLADSESSKLTVRSVPNGPISLSKPRMSLAPTARKSLAPRPSLAMRSTSASQPSLAPRISGNPASARPTKAPSSSESLRSDKPISKAGSAPKQRDRQRKTSSAETMENQAHKRSVLEKSAMMKSKARQASELPNIDARAASKSLAGKKLGGTPLYNEDPGKRIDSSSAPSTIDPMRDQSASPDENTDSIQDSDLSLKIDSTQPVVESNESKQTTEQPRDQSKSPVLLRSASPTSTTDQLVSPVKDTGVKRRGLFQRQFLARPETEETDSSMDSLLNTDIGDLSAQFPREDWQTHLLDTPGPLHTKKDPKTSKVDELLSETVANEFKTSHG
ncbi:tubulin-dependent ATPase kip3 [Malassezia yamatoensis]|uniref:Tubulin-dependent ATPase kip3 n=1 Tax=Malassezia yamatoensis TaxID=253288 RepID=A0AAJ6CFF0_9BASI|nr:tubulin-dependent ATPase kip3 [Malassezia yamatoensis]